MIKALLLALAVLTASPASPALASLHSLANPGGPKLTVVSDNRMTCGVGHVADNMRDRNDRLAQKLAYAKHAEGYDVTLIRLSPGQRLDTAGPVPIYKRIVC